MEKLSDKLFNADPYEHQGGDMLRTCGVTYACEPAAAKGARISDLRLKGEPIDADKSYKVARWGVGSSALSSHSEGVQVWDVVEQYLRQSRVAHIQKPNVPRLTGVDNNPGIALDHTALS